MTKGLPRGIRNKNPGNIRLASFKWVGQIDPQPDDAEKSFCRFEHPIFGLRAIAKVLLVYHNYREASDGSAINTVGEVIDRWAPPNENDTESYKAHVRDLLDVESGEIIDLDDAGVLVPLMQAIVCHENGQDPYPVRWYELGADLGALT